MSSHTSLDSDSIQQSVKFIRQHVSKQPTVGVICGSGLGGLADNLQKKIVLKYEDIPNFPCSTVAGHVGNLVFGELGGKYVVAMQGRFHFYEGYSKNELIAPIRVMKLLGVQTLLITNAAGGLNRSYKLGHLVVIKDHISFPGLSLNNVLVGPNDSKFGERFVPMSDAYSSRLRKLFKSIASANGYGQVVAEGVYAHVGGPTYESPAECRMLLLLGSDVVGMSTVPEVVVAKHAGMEVFALSLVTNMSVMSEESTEKANHEEVLEVAAASSKILQELMGKLIADM